VTARTRRDPFLDVLTKAPGRRISRPGGCAGAEAQPDIRSAKASGRITFPDEA
jgi:hypothetical protein